ncbi:MAG: hypothetical protein QXL86_03390 [Candidatus Aenigmatarchaeota archaeon]
MKIKKYYIEELNELLGSKKISFSEWYQLVMVDALRSYLRTLQKTERRIGETERKLIYKLAASDRKVDF